MESEGKTRSKRKSVYARPSVLSLQMGKLRQVRPVPRRLTIVAASKPSTRESSGYSALNVIEGSTLAARQAGIQQAIAETATSSAMTAR